MRITPTRRNTPGNALCLPYRQFDDFFWHLDLAVDRLAAIRMQQNADKLPDHHLVMLVQQLQVGDYLQFVGFEYRTDRRRCRPTFISPEAQPVDGHMQPICQGAQLVLRGDSFAHQPFSGCMDGNGTPRIADVEITCQLRRAIGRMMRIAQSLLKTQTKSLSLVDFLTPQVVAGLSRPSSGVMGTTWCV